MSELDTLLRERGRMTFAEFMAEALYHPRYGYYTRPRAGHGPAGRSGDFLTAPTASPLFSRTLAGMLRRLAERRGEPLTYVELGAGEGLLMRGVLEALGDDRAALRRVVAVEAGAWARERLAAVDRDMEVHAELHEAERPWGPVVVFASELYDAFPAHRVRVVRRDGEILLQELFVEAAAGDRLDWALGPPSTDAIEGYLVEHGVRLAEGQTVELRPGVRAFHRDVLAWCGEEGVALILDYGHPGRKLYDPRARGRGTLVGYREHRLVEDVLEDAGEVDITAHVNFDDLETAGADLGWESSGLTPLGLFLAAHGAVGLLPAAAAAGEPMTAEDWAELSAAKRLLLPSGMGSDLKVLAQGRGRVWATYGRLVTPPPGDA